MEILIYYIDIVDRGVPKILLQMHWMQLVILF